MFELTRDVLVQHIQARPGSVSHELVDQWRSSQPTNHCVIDDLPSDSWAHEIRHSVLRSVSRENAWLRMAIGKMFPTGITDNPHFYESQRGRQPQRPPDQR